MSERDLPDRLEGTAAITYLSSGLRCSVDLDDLSTFEASDKEGDPRHDWFVNHYGDTCAELDAMDPNDLRARVEEAILDEIEPEAWDRSAKVNKAEQESLRAYFNAWK